jgi:hypothetical protein
VYFLKDALDMQEALANGAGSRNNFRSHNFHFTAHYCPEFEYMVKKRTS